jgi:hypothetical protein
MRNISAVPGAERISVIESSSRAKRMFSMNFPDCAERNIIHSQSFAKNSRIDFVIALSSRLRY